MMPRPRTPARARTAPRLLTVAAAIALAACSGRGSPGVTRVNPQSVDPPTPTPTTTPPPTPTPDTSLTAWTAYQANPNAAPNIPNNSFAGYHYGADTLPTNANARTFDVSMAPYNVTPNTPAGAATTAVRGAIADAARAGGGVVFFPAGTYQMAGPLIVNNSNIVLRGADMASTTLSFVGPLNATLGASVNGQGASNWSEEGGLVWFAPPRVMAYHNPVQNMASQTYWGLTQALGAVSAPAARGDTQLQLANVANVPVGGLIALQMVNPNDNSLAMHLAGDGNWADAYPWSQATELQPQANGDITSGVLTWPVEVAAVAQTGITLAQPLRFDVRANWTPQLYVVQAPVRESGIENITLTMQRTQTWDPNTTHHHEVGWNGAFFSNCFNCWARAVTVQNPEGLAFGVAGAKNVTLTGVHVTASSAALAAHHHAFVVRVDAQDTLVDTFTVDSMPYHGLSLQARAMGTVFTRGTMAHGTFDAHALLPVDALFTDIDIVNDGARESDAAAGPAAGARFVSWNVRVTGGLAGVAPVAAMPMGAVAGVNGAFGVSTVDPVQGDSRCVVGADATPAPANLYDAELQLRGP